MRASWRNTSKERRSARASSVEPFATPPSPSRSFRFCAALLSETRCAAAARCRGGLPSVTFGYTPVKGINPNSQAVEERPARDDAPFSALAFKIMTDPFVGTLSFFRVYSGSLTSGAAIYNSTKSKRERIGRLLKMHANKREGDQGSLCGRHRGGGRTQEQRRPAIRFAMKTIRSFWNPLIFQTRLSLLRSSPRARRIKRDWVFRFRSLRLKILLSEFAQTKKLARRSYPAWASFIWKLSLIDCCGNSMLGRMSGKPQVAYKETIRKAVEQQGRFIRQTGGRGQYGDVWIKLEPLAPGAGSSLSMLLEVGRFPEIHSSCRKGCA